jgi:citrate lyase beta subunit
MPTTLLSGALRDLLGRLAQTGRPAAAVYSGPAGDRQPAHTVYGGAHLFRADVAARLGAAALAALEAYAPAPGALAEVAEIGDPLLAAQVRERVIAKLRGEPVEDYRIDFEDGYGERPADEEDAHASAAALEMARGLEAGTLPRGSGVRLKALDPAHAARALGTLDRFASVLLEATGGRLPAGFAVTLPKVASGAEVAVLADALDALEHAAGLPERAIAIEIMVETPRALLAPDGGVALPALVAAGRGRVRSCHFGPYDFLAALGVAGADQRIDHPACDLARQLMTLALAGGNIAAVDGPVVRLPVPVHRAAPGGAALGGPERDANARAVRDAWREHARAVRAALRRGIHQGWDVHPAQLVSRWAALHAFYLGGRHDAAARLGAYLGRASRATLTGATFDDASTALGLLTFFRRGAACGALGEEDLRAAGITREQAASATLAAIVEARRASA